MSFINNRSRSTFSGVSRRLLRLSAACVAFALLLPGCPPPPAEPAPPQQEQPLKGVTLRAIVVDDPALAHAITLARGQWNAETGSELKIESMTADEVVSADKLAADVVIYPPALLGTLVERKLLRPLDSKELDDPQLDWADVFELVKTREVSWGKEIYAVPFGSPVLLCFYRADLLEELGAKPPRTWAAYIELAQKLQTRDATPTDQPSAPGEDKQIERGANAAWRGTVEPLAPGWGALTFLAHAAPYARHANHYSTLFNMQTMEPLIASPPFVRALDEMVTAARVAPTPAMDYGPAEAWRAISSGNAGMALCWPALPPAATVEDPAALDADATARPPKADIACVTLPGTVDVFNATSGKWEKREATASVPLLGVSGRVGSVTASSTQPKAALQLMAWLTSPKGIERLAAARAEIAPFRGAQSRTPALVGGSRLTPGEASQYAEAAAESLGATDCLVVLRIPGADRYLHELDEAVREAVEGQATPEHALAAVAESWRAITADLGVEKQRAAYKQSLGLSP